MLILRQKNIISKNIGYRIQELIYDYDCEPHKGYVLYYEWSLFGVRGSDTIAICCSKTALDKELSIRNLTFDTVPKYKN